MAACAKCGNEYVQGAKGWFARVEGLGPGGRGDGPLTRVLLCPDHFAEIPRAERAAWHEYTGAPSGPTWEKRVGRLAGTGRNGEPGKHSLHGSAPPEEG